MITVMTREGGVYLNGDDFVVDNETGFLAIYKGGVAVAAFAQWNYVINKGNSETTDPA